MAVRTERFELRLPPDKKALWESRAKEEGISLAKWIERNCDMDVYGEGVPVSDFTKDFSESHDKATHAQNCRCLSCRPGKGS